MSIESVVSSNHLILSPHHLILSPPSPLAYYISQHQDLFQWVDSLHQVVKVLELQLQYQSFQWIFRIDFLSGWLFWSSCCRRDSQVSSAPQFESTNSLVLRLLYGPTLTSIHDCWKNHSFDYMDGLLLAKWCLCFVIHYRFVMAFLPRSKHLLILWLQSLSTVILEPKKVESIEEHFQIPISILFFLFHCSFLMGSSCNLSAATQSFIAD